MLIAAKGDPAPLINWISSGDGSLLADIPGLRQAVASNGTLMYSPFAATYYRPDIHSGTIRCSASNSAGTVLSRDVKIRAGQFHPLSMIKCRLFTRLDELIDHLIGFCAGSHRWFARKLRTNQIQLIRFCRYWPLLIGICINGMENSWPFWWIGWIDGTRNNSEIEFRVQPIDWKRRVGLINPRKFQLLRPFLSLPFPYPRSLFHLNRSNRNISDSMKQRMETSLGNVSSETNELVHFPLSILLIKRKQMKLGYRALPNQNSIKKPTDWNALVNLLTLVLRHFVGTWERSSIGVAANDPQSAIRFPFFSCLESNFFAASQTHRHRNPLRPIAFVIEVPINNKLGRSGSVWLRLLEWMNEKTCQCSLINLSINLSLSIQLVYLLKFIILRFIHDLLF